MWHMFYILFISDMFNSADKQNVKINKTCFAYDCAHA